MSKFESAPTIRIVYNGDAPREFHAARVVVGRGDQADYKIPSELISREHLEISFDNGVLWLRDLGSMNGSFIAGRRLAPRVRVPCSALQSVRLGHDVFLSITIGNVTHITSESEVPVSESTPLPLGPMAPTPVTAHSAPKVESSIRSVPRAESSIRSVPRSESSIRSTSKVESSIRSTSSVRSRTQSQISQPAQGDKKSTAAKTEASLSYTGWSRVADLDSGDEFAPEAVSRYSEPVSEDSPVARELRSKPAEENERLQKSFAGLSTELALSRERESELSEQKQNQDAALSRAGAKMQLLEQQIADLTQAREREREKLRTAIAGQNSELSLVQTRHAEQLAQIAKLENLLADAKHRADSLEKKLGDSERDREKELRSFERWKDELRFETEEAKKEVAARENDLGEERAKLLRATEEFETQKEMSERTLTLMESSRVQIAAEIENLRRREQGLRETSQVIENKLEAVQSELKNATGTLSQVQARSSDLTQQISKKEQFISKMDDKIRSLDHRLEELRRIREEELRGFETWKEESQKERLHGQAELDERRREVDFEKVRLNVSIQELQSQKEIAERSLATATSSRSEILSEVEGLRREADNLESSRAGSQQKIQQLQAEIKAATADLISLHSRQAELGQAVARSEASFAQAAEQTRAAENQLAEIRKNRDEEAKAAEKWRENHLRETRQAEGELATRRHEIDGERSRLQIALQELQAQKELSERSLALIEVSRAQAAGDVEGLRREEAEILSAVQRGQERLDGFQAEMRKLSSMFEEVSKQKSDLERSFGATQREVAQLEYEAKEKKIVLDKLVTECNALSENLARERATMMEEVRQSATQQAEAIAEAARSETQRKIEEMKAQVGQELEQERLRVHAELENASRKATEEVQRIREQGERDARTRMTELEHSLDEKRKLADRQIGERMMLERQQANARREQEERETKERKELRITQIRTNLEQMLGIRLKEFLNRNGNSTDELIVLLKEIPPIVESAFTPGQGRAEQNKQQLLSVDPEGRKGAKRFWGHFAWAMAGIATCGVIWFFFSEPITRHLVNLFPAESAADRFVKMVARDLAARPKFNPTMDTEYKATYVDNVVYTIRYVEIKLDDAVQKQWVLQLNHFFLSDLHLDEKVIVKFVATEINLIRKLNEMRGFINPTYEKDAVGRMREVENAALPELVEEVKGDANYAKVREFEKNFYSKIVNEAAPAPSTPVPNPALNSMPESKPPSP